MAGYTPVFRSILTSTIWLEKPHVKVVWWTLLLMCDRAGNVEGSVPGLAKEAVVSIEECREALSVLMAPDPESRTKEFEGRRVEVIEGGWKLLNHRKYKDKLHMTSESTRERVARHRAKKAACNASVTHVTASNGYTPPGNGHVTILDPRSLDPRSEMKKTQSAEPPSAPTPAPAESRPVTRQARARTEWDTLSIRDLARRARENPSDASFVDIAGRPEVKEIHEAWCQSVGLKCRALGAYSARNRQLCAILEALETHMLDEVLAAAKQAAHDPYCTGEAPGPDKVARKRGIECLTPVVLTRLLDACECQAVDMSQLDPRVRKMLEEDAKKSGIAHSSTDDHSTALQYVDQGER